MDEDREALQPVIRYLAENGEREDGLTAEKVGGRGVVIRDSGRPGWIVFEVERHRGILGTYYERGKPMEAFVTYSNRYAFHPETEQFENLGVVGRSEVAIDYDAVADRFVSDVLSFEFEALEDGRYRCLEGGRGGKQAIVRDVGEAEAFARECASALSFEGHRLELSEYVDPEYLDEILDKLAQAFAKAFIIRVRRDWEYFREHP